MTLVEKQQETFPDLTRKSNETSYKSNLLKTENLTNNLFAILDEIDFDRKINETFSVNNKTSENEKLPNQSLKICPNVDFSSEINEASFINNKKLKKIKLSDYSLEIFNEIVSSTEIKEVFKLFELYEKEIRIAGGAIRDILMNIKPHDIDFATDATPDEMKEMFEENHIRLINANGESHGTITARINDKENFEITTLRYDKVTDGRRAQVVFTKDWAIDAERRDLTINSMFLDKHGFVYDYFTGMLDIASRTVRFVGDPEKRIQEDYLRILRYFRFYGRIAENSDDHLEETIEKIRENGSSLQNVSGERIWTELKNIISGNHAKEIISKMSECGILTYLGLPDKPNFGELAEHYDFMKKNKSNPSVFLSTLFEGESELTTAWKRLKFSNNELICASFVLKHREDYKKIINENSFGVALDFFQKEFIMHTGEPSLDKLKMAYHEYFKYADRLDIWESFNEWEPPKFPINGKIITNQCQIKGKQIGLALAFLKRKWVDSDFKAGSKDLLEDDTFQKRFR